jgi:hypothetical protein
VKDCYVFKNGSRDEVLNYRAKLSSIPKLFESIENDILVAHVTDAIPDSQHGFE